MIVDGTGPDGSDHYCRVEIKRWQTERSRASVQEALHEPCLDFRRVAAEGAGLSFVGDVSLVVEESRMVNRSGHPA